MNWDDLHTFLAIARHGTLSAAARANGVTQPTMGRRLAALERRTGARLLQKFPDGYAVTPLGEAIMRNAERIEAEVLSADRTITGRDIELAGKVRVTTVGILANHILTPALADLQIEHPGIEIEMVPDSRSLSLSKREADIAVRMTRFEGHELVSRKVGALAFGVYASNAYLDNGDRAEHAHSLITVLDDQSHLPEAVWLRDTYPGGRRVFSSNSREVQLWAAKSGVGIAVLPAFRADPQPELVKLNSDSDDLNRDVWMGVHGDMRNMPRIKAVTETIAKTFNENLKRTPLL